MGEAFIVRKGGGIDTSDATATETKILAPETAYVNGVKITGNIPSKIAATITPTESAQEIAAGQYLSGIQTIAAVPTEEKSATPTTSAQDITPTSGKFLTKVAVGAIPAAYKDMTTADIVAANVLNGKKGGNSTGVITGTMPNNAGDKAAVSYHRDGTSIHIVPALGYTDGSDDSVIITDAEFITGNIRAGKNIFGLDGKTEVVDTTSGDAVAENLENGKKAWVKGVEITGNHVDFTADYIDLIEGDDTITSLPTGITSIGTFVLSYNPRLAITAIPSGVITIGESAFEGDEAITELACPSTLTTIEQQAFARCTGLTKVWIPSSVTTINGLIFSYCDSGCEVYCQAASRPVGWDTEWNRYDDTNFLTIHWGSNISAYNAG